MASQGPARPGATRRVCAPRGHTLTNTYDTIAVHGWPPVRVGGRTNLTMPRPICRGLAERSVTALEGPARHRAHRANVTAGSVARLCPNSSGLCPRPVMPDGHHGGTRHDGILVLLERREHVAIRMVGVIAVPILVHRIRMQLVPESARRSCAIWSAVSIPASNISVYSLRILAHK